MYTQHSRLKGNPDGRIHPETYLEALAEPGPTVRLLAQSGENLATYETAAGKSETVPCFDFFATHREATPEEIEAFDAASQPPPESARAAKDAAKAAASASAAVKEADKGKEASS